MLLWFIFKVCSILCMYHICPLFVDIWFLCTFWQKRCTAFFHAAHDSWYLAFGNMSLGQELLRLIWLLLKHFPVWRCQLLLIVTACPVSASLNPPIDQPSKGLVWFWFSFERVSQASLELLCYPGQLWTYGSPASVSWVRIRGMSHHTWSFIPFLLLVR